jgi:aminoglycoside 6'-N-acetyltransferase
MRLRRTTLADLPILRHWDAQPHVIAASGDDDWFDWESELPRIIDWRELLIAAVEGRPIGFIQIIDPAREETHYWGDCEPCAPSTSGSTRRRTLARATVQR